MRKKKLIDDKYRYYAFIAYTRYNEGADFPFANWLYEKMQMYRLPVKLVKMHNTPKYLKPIFLDFRCMKPIKYKVADIGALEQSKYLIVLCSKNLVQHDSAVNDEIINFLKTHKDVDNAINRVIPVIIDGTTKDAVTKCFPSILAKMEDTIVAPNVSTPNGHKDYYNALFQIIAHMHGIETEELEILDRKRRKKVRILASITVSFLILLFSLFGLWINEKNDIKNGIQEAVTMSENNTYQAITQLLDVERQQDKFGLHNEDVYSAIESAVKYNSGQCLRKKQFNFKNIESVNVVNSTGNLFGVKTKDRYYVIDMNDFKIKYEISANNLWYQKGDKNFQMILHNSDEESKIEKVWVDNEKVYISFEQTIENEKKLFEVVVELEKNNSYEADIIWDDNLYAKKYDGIQIVGPVIAIADQNGDFVSIVHDADVKTYAVRYDQNIIWSMDEKGCAYAWAMKNGYSLVDKMADNYSNCTWGVTTDGLLFKLDLENNKVTKIIKAREICLVGQDENNVFFTIKSDTLKYPGFCKCEKSSGAVEQIHKIPDIAEEDKHIMGVQTNSLINNEGVAIARDVIEYIAGNNTEDEIYNKNNAIKFVNIDDDETAIDIKLRYSLLGLEEVNPMEITVLSNFDRSRLVPIIDCLKEIKEQSYKINDGEWKSIYTDSGILNGIKFPDSLEYGKEHILYIKAITKTGIESIKSFRFIMENKELQWNVKSGDKRLTINEVTEISDSSIVIECRENENNSVKEITYAFDNEPEVFKVQGRIADIKIPEKYLDKEEHKLLVYFSSENVVTDYYVYPFKCN